MYRVIYLLEGSIYSFESRLLVVVETASISMKDVNAIFLCWFANAHVHTDSNQYRNNISYQFKKIEMYQWSGR